jgi:GH43 family beta-xylosidase
VSTGARAVGRALLAIAVVTSACGRGPVVRTPTPAAHERLVNPIVRQRADPHVSRDSTGRYYLAATVPEYDRIELRSAATIEGLGAATPVVVWRKHATGAMGSHIWAPELHRIDGKWYIYFAAGRADSVWNIRIYALESASEDPLRGTWIEKGQIDTGWESFALDATTFVHRGRRYLLWAQKDPAIRGNTNLYIAPMRDATTLAGPAVRLSKPELPWEIVGYWVNEGPAVLIRNGRVFLTYSASATDANYCMGMLVASDTSDLLDPRSWTKSAQPVFRSSAATGQWGPGHNSFTVDASGADVIVYHARNYREIAGDPLHDPNRHTRAQYVGWHADGTPDFGEPVPDGVVVPVPASVAP